LDEARTDREVLAAHLAGESGAFEVAVRRHLAMVLAACRRLLGPGPDAEDAAQAAFLVLLRKAPELARGTGDLGAWLHRAAGLVSRTALRARATRLRHEKEAAAMREERNASSPARGDMPEGLDSALDALPARNREALVLTYFEGLSQRQAAKRLSLPASTVAMRCSRGLELLRSRLSAGDRARLSAAALGALLLESFGDGAAAAPDSLLSSVLSLANGATAGAEVAAMAKGALKMMMWSKTKPILAAVLAALILAGAGPLALHALAGGGDPGPAAVKKPVPPKTPQVIKAPPTVPEPPAAVAAPVKRPKVDEADKGEAAGGMNAFGVDLYGKLVAEKKRAGKNVFFSPFSISTALAMTYAGAKGNTAAQMKKVMHYTLKDEKLHPAVGALVDDLNAEGKKGKFALSAANALWGQKGYKFLDPFLALNKRDYGAGLQLVDFSGKTELARKTINAWVEKQTRDKIKELLKPGILTVDTRLVLTNAIYFKAEWLTKFDSRMTREMPFRLDAKKSVKVPTMSHDNRFPNGRVGDLQLLELPYVGKRFSMVVLLPKKVDGLAALEKSLTAEKLRLWMESLRPGRVMVRLPKFSVTSEFRLDDQLKALGMKDAFQGGVADLSGMDGKKRWLFIQAVVHKAFVAVTEKGTEAGAATAVVVGAESMPPQFIADHPFLFLIRDRVTGAILFMGRVTNPQG
jgi:serpin B